MVRLTRYTKLKKLKPYCKILNPLYSTFRRSILLWENRYYHSVSLDLFRDTEYQGHMNSSNREKLSGTHLWGFELIVCSTPPSLSSVSWLKQQHKQGFVHCSTICCSLAYNLGFLGHAVYNSKVQDATWSRWVLGHQLKEHGRLVFQQSCWSIVLCNSACKASHNQVYWFFSIVCAYK